MISLEERALLLLKKVHQIGEDDFSADKITCQDILTPSASSNNQIIRTSLSSHKKNYTEKSNNQLESDDSITSKLYCRTNTSIKPLYPYSQISENRDCCQLLKSDNILLGAWKNIYISTAIPLLLQIERIGCRSNSDFSEIIEARLEIVRKIYHFKHQLNKQGHPLEEIEHLSYLLCTYIDDINITKGLPEKDHFHLSLLMEFHKETWGGANCFIHLKNYLPQIENKRNILEFYYLIISLGFEGKYKMHEQGSTLLMELRTDLNTLLYSQNPTRKLTDISLSPTSTPPNLIKILKKGLTGVIIFLFIYGICSWYLYQPNHKIENGTKTWSEYLNLIEHTDAIPLKGSSLNYTLKISEKKTIAMADKLRDGTSINQTHNREIIAIEQGESEPISDNTTRK
nr:type IVB secretion system protein IcmH/DotU [uncultured Moellerella sp.]